MEKRILVAFALTTFGSSLASVGTFISIYEVFGSVALLAVALSLRTVVMFFSSFLTTYLFNKKGVKHTLIISEIFGILSTLILLLGMDSQTSELVLVAIILLGVPSIFLKNGLIAILKINLNCDNKFRTASGNLGVIAGSSILLAGIFAPLIINKINFNFIIYLDVITFIAGIAIVSSLKNSKEPGSDNQSIDLRSTFNSLLDDIKVDTKISKSYTHLAPTLILMGLIPILAGGVWVSSDIQIFDIQISKFFWTLEGLSLLISGHIYKYFRNSITFNFIVNLSVLPLCIYFVFGYPILLVFGTWFIAMSYFFNFTLERDNRLQFVKKPHEVYQITASYSRLMSLFCITSPIIIGFLSEFISFYQFTILLLLIQLILGIKFLVRVHITKKKVCHE